MTFLWAYHPRFSLNPFIQQLCSLQLPRCNRALFFYFLFITWNKNCINVANDGFLLNYVPLKSEYPLMLLIFRSELLLLFNQIKFNKFRFPQRPWSNLIEIFQPTKCNWKSKRERTREQHTYNHRSKSSNNNNKNIAPESNR